MSYLVERGDATPGVFCSRRRSLEFMKLVMYAGQQLVTTDEVANVLVTLAVAVANEGSSRAVQIPIMSEGREGSAVLIIGVGNSLLVKSQTDAGDDVDFSRDAVRLRAHPLYPEQHHQIEPESEPPYQWWEPELLAEINPER